MNKIDELIRDTINIDEKWVVARPIKSNLKQRINDAIKVVLGKADAITYYKQ